MTTLADFAIALAAVEDVLRRYEPVRASRWRMQSVDDHVAHARAHLEAWQVERRCEDLGHAATRGIMALALALEAAAAPPESAP